jgi:hypothetical protein
VKPMSDETIRHQRIVRGAFLIRGDARYFESLGEMSPFSERWSLVTESLFASSESAVPLREAIRSLRAGAIRRAAAGTDRQEMMKGALQRVLAAAGLRDCNCLEIEEIKMHAFRTIHYASVSGYGYRLRSSYFSDSPGQAERVIVRASEGAARNPAGDSE